MIKVKKFQNGGSNTIKREQEILYLLGLFGNIPYRYAVDGIYGRRTRAAENEAIRRKLISRELLEKYKGIYSAVEKNNSSLSSAVNSFMTPRYRGYTIKGDPDVFKLLVDLMEKGLLTKRDLDGILGPKTKRALNKANLQDLNTSNNNNFSIITSASGFPLLIKEENPLQYNGKKLEIPKTPLDRHGKATLECAAYVNGLLESKGISSGGDAYAINDHHRKVLNGYDGIDSDSLYDKGNNLTRGEVLKFNRNAALKFKNNFNVNNLNKNHVYTINMYYASSPYMIDFFRRAKESGNSSYGTHAGIVYYDGKQWKVTDNIHGTIHDRSLNSVLGGNGSIGITSMSDAGSL